MSTSVVAAIAFVIIAGLTVLSLLVRADLGDAHDLLVMWKTAYAGEVVKHEATLATLASIKQAHTQLQDDYLRQGRALTIAEGLARAAERIHS